MNWSEFFIDSHNFFGRDFPFVDQASILEATNGSDVMAAISVQELDRRFLQLDEVLKGLGIRDTGELELARPYCSPVDFAVSGLLHEAGQIADRVFFVCRGLVRFYYLTEAGVEHNKSFTRENQFAGAPQAAHDPESVRFFVQALEPTQTMSLTLDGLNSLYRRSLAWANLGRLYMEEMAARKARREGEFLLDSARQRYERFLREEPELAARLPLYHVASYLGITDVALSRIRRRIKKEQDLNLG